MLGEWFPVIEAELLDQSAQFVLLGFGPGLLRLVGESAVAAVAHFAVSARHTLGHFFKTYILVLAKSEQNSVFFLAPSLFGLLVALSQQILSRHPDFLLLKWTFTFFWNNFSVFFSGVL